MAILRVSKTVMKDVENVKLVENEQERVLITNVGSFVLAKDRPLVVIVQGDVHKLFTSSDLAVEGYIQHTIVVESLTCSGAVGKISYGTPVSSINSMIWDGTKVFEDCSKRRQFVRVTGNLSCLVETELLGKCYVYVCGNVGESSTLSSLSVKGSIGEAEVGERAEIGNNIESFQFLNTKQYIDRLKSHADAKAMVYRSLFGIKSPDHR